MPLFGRKKKQEDEKAQEGGKKKKLTKKEKEKAEAELRANLPTRGQVGRKGVFEMTGSLAYTFAVGQIPGGQFYPIDVVLKGHQMYIFELGSGSMPSLKPRGFFMVKRAIVTEMGMLMNPPLPPHTNVFKIEFAKKQMGHRAYFFKCASTKELRRWIADLSWRVEEGERKIAAKFEPGVKGGTQPAGGAMELPIMARYQIDETEAGVGVRHVSGARVLGMTVKYETKPPQEDEDDEETEQAIVEQKAREKVARAKLLAGDGRGNFKG